MQTPFTVLPRVALITCCLFAGTTRFIAAAAPAEVAGLAVEVDYFPGASYDSAIPGAESLLGFKIGTRAASVGEVERCLKAWTAAAPDRTRLVEYARSHEVRALHYVIVTSPGNLARIEAIEAGLAKLGDPRHTDDAAAAELISSLPAVAWLAYTIHGDETEGSDAALAVLYHLIAANDPETARMREELVIVLDPVMNPDGRDRFVKMVAENRGTAPNLDDQALVHDGYWPYGRGNHYLFDLNRDWLWAVHPESRGRLRELARWNPVLFVDAHGMGSQDTHLFSPPREPINPNIPAGRLRWGELFARDQAQAFDRHGLVYYTGEWHEEWYPGYSDAYASYRGAVGILYEQARIAADGVRRPEGRILSYAQSVQHHVIGSMANLRTAQKNAKELLRGQREVRKQAVDPNGPYAKRTFAVLPTGNQSRLQDFLELVRLHGFEAFQLKAPFLAAQATNQLGETVTQTNLPTGTVLIPNRQPLGHLLAAALEFDPRLSAKALDEERQELLRTGGSKVYDTTSWNLTMFYNLPALTLPVELPEGAERLEMPIVATGGLDSGEGTPVAYVIDGADDLSVTAAARLMESGVQVRVADREFELDGRRFTRGSVVVTTLDNRDAGGDLRRRLESVLSPLGLTARAVTSGLGPGEWADLGGQHFLRLEPPRIALLGRGRFDTTDYGALWHTLDHRLGTRHSQIEDGSVDLGRYNVLIVPNAWGGAGGLSLDSIKEWVRDGGTLIAVGSAAGRFTSEGAAFSKVRPLPEVIAKLAEYEQTILREWLGRGSNTVTTDQLWAHQPPLKLEYPWQAVGGAHPEEKELKKRDGWQALFMPQGAVLAGRVDTNHWLTFGCAEPISLLADRRSVLMAAEGVEAPIRYGYLTASEPRRTNEARAAEPASTKPQAPAETGAGDDDSKASKDKKEKPEPARVGWSALPPGTEMHLRQSGLVWPEATHRIANTAYVTRESFGRGQIILFATPPTFRASTRGTTRVFLNAVVCGPGLGASHSLRP